MDHPRRIYLYGTPGANGGCGPALLLVFGVVVSLAIVVGKALIATIAFILSFILVIILIAYIIASFCDYSASRKMKMEENQAKRIVGIRSFGPRELLTYLETSGEEADPSQGMAGPVSCGMCETFEESYRNASRAYLLRMRSAGRNEFSSFLKTSIIEYLSFKSFNISNSYDDISRMRYMITNHEGRADRELFKMQHDAILYRSGAKSFGPVSSAFELRCICMRTLIDEEWLCPVYGQLVGEELDSLVDGDSSKLREFGNETSAPKDMRACLLSGSDTPQDFLSHERAHDIVDTVSSISTLEGSLCDFGTFHSLLIEHGLTDDLYLNNQEAITSLNIYQQSIFIRDMAYWYADIIKDSSDKIINLIRIAIDAALYRFACNADAAGVGLDRLLDCLKSVHLPIEEVPFFFRSYIYYNALLYSSIDYEKFIDVLKSVDSEGEPHDRA